MTHEDFIQLCINEREILSDVITQMEEWDHVTPQGWTMTELLGHILWYEIQMVHLLTKRSLGDDPYWLLSHSDRNEKIRQNYSKYTLDTIRAEFIRVGKELVKAFRDLDPDELDVPKNFGMPENWNPVDILDQNLLAHYKQHHEQFRIK